MFKNACAILCAAISVLITTNVFGKSHAAQIESHEKICRDMLINAKTTDDFMKIGRYECLLMLRRGDADRLVYKAQNGKCTSKRVGSISRRAENLHKEARKGNPDQAKLERLANKMRKNAWVRSSMFTSCYKTMVDTIEKKVVVPIL